MGKYNGAVITAAGQNLIAQAIAESKTVTFTTAQASSHVYPSTTDFEALTALTDVESTVNINYAGVYSDTVVQVSARFDNGGVETAYLINTLGFFAQLGTDTPILFAVSTAVTPDQMPVFDADNPSAFIYNMQMTVQNADSINLSVNPAGTVTVEQLNTVINTINVNIGDLSDLTTTDKSSLVNAINEVDVNADAAQTSANNAQQMIAPIQSNLTASKAYAVDEQFVYNGSLYKVTAAIAQGGTITIGGNCELANSVTKQIETIRAIGDGTNFFGVLINTALKKVIKNGCLTEVTLRALEGQMVESQQVGQLPLFYAPLYPIYFPIVGYTNSAGTLPIIGTGAILTDGKIYMQFSQSVYYATLHATFITQ